jgi:hypothetical protein
MKESFMKSTNTIYLMFTFPCSHCYHSFTSSFYKFKHSFMVVFLSKGCEVLDNCFLAMCFDLQIFFLIKSAYMA